MVAIVPFISLFFLFFFFFFFFFVMITAELLFTININYNVTLYYNSALYDEQKTVGCFQVFLFFVNNRTQNLFVIAFATRLSS
jgi:hypothetical protein